MTFEAGDIIRPGKHTIERLPIATGTINKGTFVTSSSGNAVALATATSTITGCFVAAETKSFVSGGRDNDIELAGPGSYVVVTMGGAVQPGGLVKIGTSNKVVVATATDLEAEFVIGRYLKHPGEDKSTPSNDTELGIIVLGAL